VRVLFDTNVILDVLLARAPHVAPATALLDRVAARTLDGLLGTTTVTTSIIWPAKLWALGPRRVTSGHCWVCSRWHR
jgi:predicted nucleic acid-binding protein